MGKLQAPFPYFGGKSKVAGEVWKRFGSDVKSYVEPFCGSMAMLLGCPYNINYEHVNDIDGLLVNFWRAIQKDPEGLAKLAETPSGSIELSARNKWLHDSKSKINQMIKDPSYYNVEAAAYWVYVKSTLIGGSEMAIPLALRLPKLGSPQGIHAVSRRGQLKEIFSELSERLRKVAICCSEWNKVLSPTIFHRGPVAIFLDPPYQEGEFDDRVYEKTGNAFEEARDWCLKHDNDPEIRIALCGYEGNEMPDNWKELAWKTEGGFGKMNQENKSFKNRSRERIWFSPHCYDPSSDSNTVFGSFLKEEED